MRIQAIVAAIALAALHPALAEPSPVETLAASIASHLAAACPIATPDDVVAFTRCVAAIRDDRSIPFGDRLLWGGDQPDKTIRKKGVTDFQRDVYQLMYLPLFAFTGEWSVYHDDLDDVDVIRIGALFRNRLPPGEYPYPFWHSDAKWSDYEAAHGLNLYLDAQRQVVLVTRAREGSDIGRAGYAHRAPPVFDGNWQWTDVDGKTEPQASLFSNEFTPANPVLPKLDAAYKAFALELRNGTCVRCHAPNNRSGMDHLVLMQTPVHASGEIENILKQVREGDMPQNDFGRKNPLDPKLREVFLNQGEQFHQALAEAESWEKTNPKP